jgi:hypothetical protein
MCHPCLRNVLFTYVSGRSSLQSIILRRGSTQKMGAGLALRRLVALRHSWKATGFRTESLTNTEP